MNLPHSLVVVGSNKDTPAKFFTQLEPVTLDQDVGIAIKSIFHGSINNITSYNNKIHFLVRGSSASGHPSIEDVHEVIEIQEGNYTSTLAIIKEIALAFKSAFNTKDAASGGGRRKNPKNPRLVNPLREPFIDIDESELDENKDGYITITPTNMTLISNKETPWCILGYCDIPLNEEIGYRFKNIKYSKTIQPTFIYSNIVENSYINGKLSRNLSTIPLSMNSGWNFHEFHNPIFVPVDVKQFSKIVIELRDMDGEYIQFDPAFKTIINLYIKPINRSEPMV